MSLESGARRALATPVILAAGLVAVYGCASAAPPPTSALPVIDELEGPTLSPEWTVVNRETFALELREGRLHLTPNRNTVWYHKDQGPGVLRAVKGNFKLSTSARARKRSAPTQAVDAGYQFAGIIARDPASDELLGKENYVFSVVGYRGSYLSAETKTTIGGWSKVEGPPWPSGDADLRICRVGTDFSLYDRAYSGTRTATAAWKLAIRYERPDLPETLQVGPIAYTYTDAYDLVASFDYVAIEPVASAEDCARP